MNKSTKIAAGTASIIGLFALTLYGCSRYLNTPKYIATIKIPLSTVSSNTSTNIPANTKSNKSVSNKTANKIPTNTPVTFPKTYDYDTKKLYDEQHPVGDKDIEDNINTFVQRFNYANSILLNLDEFKIPEGSSSYTGGAEYICIQPSVNKSQNDYNYLRVRGYHNGNNKIYAYRFNACDVSKIPKEEIAYFYVLCTYASIPSLPKKDLGSLYLAFSLQKYGDPEDKVGLYHFNKNYELKLDRLTDETILEYAPKVKK